MGNSESSARFRGMILQLREVDAPKDSLLWEQLWKIPKSMDELFSLVQQDDIRDIFKKRPKNLYTMLNKVRIVKGYLEAYCLFYVLCSALLCGSLCSVL